MRSNSPGIPLEALFEPLFGTSFKHGKQKKLAVKLIQGFTLLFCSFTVVATPDIQTWQTENGAKVLFVPA